MGESKMNERQQGKKNIKAKKTGKVEGWQY